MRLYHADHFKKADHRDNRAANQKQDTHSFARPSQFYQFFFGKRGQSFFRLYVAFPPNIILGIFDAVVPAQSYPYACYESGHATTTP